MEKIAGIPNEDILAEAKESLSDITMRKCNQCAWRNQDCTFCTKKKIKIASWMYAGLCSDYETDEERIIKMSKQRTDYILREERKINIMMTMCLNSIDMAMLFLEDIESRLKKQYSIAEEDGSVDEKIKKADKEWIRTLKMGSKQIANHAEGMRKHYTHGFMPMFNKIFIDKTTEQYNASMFDDHQEDVCKLAEIFLRYFDGALNNPEKPKEFRESIMQLSSKTIFDNNDYKRYLLKR